MSAKTVEGKINPVCKDICVRRNIPKFVKRSYVSNNTELPRFYHLVKTHKLEQGIKIRPIVSNSNGPTTRLSWLLARILKPQLKNIPAHLENSMQLIKQMQMLDHNEWLYLRVPYVSDANDRKLTRVFKNEGFPVRIVHKSTSLRQVLRKKEDKQPNCSRLNCKTSLQKICFRKNVVYKIICNRCRNRYIGSIIRHLHDRIKEHMTQSTSYLYRVYKKKGDLKSSILLKFECLFNCTYAEP